MTALPETGRAALLRDPRFQGHDTGGHPENARRMRAIDQELAARDLVRDRPLNNHLITERYLNRGVPTP